MAAPLDIEICLVEETGLWRTRLRLAPGATVGDALAASGVAARRPAGLEGLAVAVFGRRVEPAQPLEDGDRIELLPPLTADPNLARQRRADKRRREAGDLRWLPGRSRAAGT